MTNNKKLNKKLNQLKRVISNGKLKEYNHSVEGMQLSLMKLGFILSFISFSMGVSSLFIHLFISGSVFCIGSIVIATLFLMISNSVEHKKSDYIFSEVNNIALSNKEEELKKHILLYSRKPDQEHKDFLAYFISNNFAPLFKYELKDKFIDKGNKLIIENNYHIYQYNGQLTVQIIYNKYDLNLNQDLINWYKVCLKNAQFKIDNLLEVKQKLEYFEKNKFIFDSENLNKNDKELIMILTKIKNYLVQIALKTYNGKECSYKKDNIIAINKNILSKQA